MAKDEFLRCPECGKTEFEEVALVWTRQENVRLSVSGEINYESADTVEPEDSAPVGKVYYKCDGCDGEFVFKDGKLVKADSHEDGESERMPQVRMISADFGEEVFDYNSPAEAQEGFNRLEKELKGRKDSVARTISLVLDIKTIKDGELI